MNGLFIIFSLASVYVVCSLASDQNHAVLVIVKQNYENSLSQLTEEQRNDLKQFKLLLSKDRHVNINNPLEKVSDDVLSKIIIKYLKTYKVGPYSASSSQDKFVSDCNQYLVSPCETLRGLFRVSLVLYYARLGNQEFMSSLKREPDQYDTLQTADVCETLVKSTNSICTKSYDYFLKHKRSELIGKLTQCFTGDC